MLLDSCDLWMVVDNYFHSESFFPLLGIVVAVCKLSTDKLQNPRKVQISNGANKWIN